MMQKDFLHCSFDKILYFIPGCYRGGTLYIDLCLCSTSQEAVSYA